ncbi:MAG: preprotein translocase subunit SecG [Treponema sp.]|jgi:preprotein translocase subunit SecG|nr:preprotein translocase subunit SecG [Treponema sp.]
MGVLGVVLLVFFILIAVLLILLVLIQNEEGDSLGGIFAGGSSSAFGSRSGNVLTRATTILGALFLVISLGMALLNRTPGGTGVESAGRQLSNEAASSNWVEDELKALEEGPAAAEQDSGGAVETFVEPQAGPAVPE